MKNPDQEISDTIKSAFDKQLQLLTECAEANKSDATALLQTTEALHILVKIAKEYRLSQPKGFCNMN